MLFRSLAALEATLRGPRTPTWEALHTDPDRLRERTEALREAAGVGEVAATSAVVGGGGAPDVELPSYGLALPSQYAAGLRTGEPPVLGRVERGRLLLDLRCVPPEWDEVVAGAIRRVARCM